MFHLLLMKTFWTPFSLDSIRKGRKEELMTLN